MKDGNATASDLLPWCFSDDMIECKVDEIKGEQSCQWMDCVQKAKEIIDALGDRVACVYVSDVGIQIYTDRYYKDL